jgi:hypothetical protein
MKRSWILGCLALAACGSASEVPDTPDLSELQHEYAFPTAVLDAESVDSTLAEIPSLRRLAAGFRAASYATRGVDGASESAGRDKEGGLEIQGSIRVTLRCPGDLEDPSYDAAENGTFSLTVGVKKSHIQRGVGGRATNCVLRAEDSGGLSLRVEVDGPIEFDLGHDISLRDRWSGQLLMRITGDISIGDLELTNLSARFTSEKFEYLFGLEDETWIVAELTNEGVAIRDANRRWLCPDGQPCGF